MHVRKDDMVEVITGDDAGTPKARTTGRVLRVLPAKSKVVVEGINRVYKHLKPNRQQSARRPAVEGNADRRLERPAVLLHLPPRRAHRPTLHRPMGRKERYCKKCGNDLGMLSKSRPGLRPEDEECAEARKLRQGVL